MKQLLAFGELLLSGPCLGEFSHCPCAEKLVSLIRHRVFEEPSLLHHVQLLLLHLAEHP